MEPAAQVEVADPDTDEAAGEEVVDDRQFAEDGGGGASGNRITDRVEVSRTIAGSATSVAGPRSRWMAAT